MELALVASTPFKWVTVNRRPRQPMFLRTLMLD